MWRIASIEAENELEVDEEVKDDFKLLDQRLNEE